MTLFDYLFNLHIDFLEKFVNLSKIDMLQTKLSLRNTRNELFNACYEFEITYRTLFMHTNLNTFILPFILLPEFFRRNKTNCDKELFAIRKLIIVIDNVLVDQSIYVVFL
jgi:hypothetical protein